MGKDKVLQRLELENKKIMLMGIKEQAKNNNLFISTNRGQYKIRYDTCLSIIVYIDTEIELINDKIEELTGLNQNKMERLYEV